ncbi:hypothetical protein VTK73DRAFT_2348 [Phialemonium thermophilum]|uniref:Uncharacterized protein n=1 Tax=Phialemonium thermophilum TaxID=223376 RepID=A0ABR3VS85_9PEZI
MYLPGEELGWYLTTHSTSLLLKSSRPPRHARCRRCLCCCGAPCSSQQQGGTMTLFMSWKVSATSSNRLADVHPCPETCSPPRPVTVLAAKPWLHATLSCVRSPLRVFFFSAQDLANEWIGVSRKCACHRVTMQEWETALVGGLVTWRISPSWSNRLAVSRASEIPNGVSALRPHPLCRTIHPWPCSLSEDRGLDLGPHVGYALWFPRTGFFLTVGRTEKSRNRHRQDRQRCRSTVSRFSGSRNVANNRVRGTGWEPAPIPLFHAGAAFDSREGNSSLNPQPPNVPTLDAHQTNSLPRHPILRWDGVILSRLDGKQPDQNRSREPRVSKRDKVPTQERSSLVLFSGSTRNCGGTWPPPRTARACEAELETAKKAPTRRLPAVGTMESRYVGH